MPDILVLKNNTKFGKRQSRNNRLAEIAQLNLDLENDEENIESKTLKELLKSFASSFNGQIIILIGTFFFLMLVYLSLSTNQSKATFIDSDKKIIGTPTELQLFNSLISYENEKDEQNKIKILVKIKTQFYQYAFQILSNESYGFDLHQSYSPLLTSKISQRMLYLSQLGKLNARQTLEEIAIKQNIMTIPEVFQPYFKDRYIQVKGRNFQVASEVMLSQLKKNVIEISLPIHFDKIKTTHQQRNELRAEIIILRNKVNKLKTMNKDIVEALSYSVGNYLMAMERDIDWSEGLAFHKTTFQMKWRTPEDKKLLAWINKMQQRNVIKVYPQHRALKLTSIQN